MKVCRNVDDWIEENIEQEVEKQESRCKKWPWPLSWLCSLVTFLVKIIVVVVRKITRVVCEIITVVVNIAAAALNLVLAFPIIGPAIKAAIRLITGALSYAAGQVIDGIGGLFGVRFTKYLRVHVVPLCIGNSPLAYEANLDAAMRETARVLYDRAQIRVRVTYRDPIRNPPEGALRLGAGADLVLDEAWWKGSWHQLKTIQLFETNVLSLFAVGHPLIVYVIREVGYDGVSSPTRGGVAGVSGGPFTDWVAVERDSVVDRVVADAGGVNPAVPLIPFPPTVAQPGTNVGVANPAYGRFIIVHEICHALGLLGHANSSDGELMVENNITGDALSPFQVGIIRNSAHVTFIA